MFKQPNARAVRTKSANANAGRAPHGAVHDSSASPFEPRWSWLIAALGIATLSLAYPVFSGAFLVNTHSDQYIAGYGFRSFAAQSLRSGNGFPQWNPFMFGGLPYVAAMHGDIFYPTFLLRLLMRTDLAMTWGFIIHTFLAGAFTLGFLRAVGLSKWAAAFGALMYMLSGPIASYASPGHDGKLFVSALLPLALWMLHRAVVHERAWAWGVFALVVGLAVLSPHPQLLQYFLLTSGAYALFFAWSCRNGQGTIAPTSGTKFVATRLSAALGMVVIGIGIGAIQYWPVMGYVNSSPRANGREYEFAAQYSLPPEELFNTYLPQFSGLLDSYWGRNQIHLHSEYLGIALLLFAPLALGAGVRRRFAIFWLATGIVALLWAMGGFTPLFHLIYLVPGTKYFRAPSTIIYVLTFAMSVLAAVGLERVLSRQVSLTTLKRYLIGWSAFGLLIAVLGVSGGLNVVAQNLGRSFALKFGHDPAGYQIFIQANSMPLAWGSVRSCAVVLAIAATLLAFSQQKLRVGAAAMLLITIGSVDLWSISHKYWMFRQPARELYAHDAIINYLKEQEQPGRVFVYTKTADYRTSHDPYFGSRGFGEGAGFMVHGIRTVSGYQGNVLNRFERLSAGNGMISPAFWQHENVRWLYTNMEIADTVLKKIYGPVLNSGGSNSYLYAMPGDNGYAWVAASYGAQEDSTVLSEIYGPQHEPRRFVAFDPATVLDGKPVTAPPVEKPAASNITNTVSSFGAGHATIQLSAPAAAGNALVISENYYKGWRAKVDGKDVPVVRASFNLIGVPLPAGARSVALTFVDERYATGRLVTLAALALSLLLITIGVRHQRRVLAPLPTK